MGTFGAAANLYLNSGESGEVPPLTPSWSKIPGGGGEDEQKSPKVAREDNRRRKKIGRRVRRKVRDQEGKEKIEGEYF